MAPSSCAAERLWSIAGRSGEAARPVQAATYLYHAVVRVANADATGDAAFAAIPGYSP